MIRSEDVYPSSMLRETALRIIKCEPGFYGVPEIHVDADFYMELVDDPHFCYETENEIIFYVRHTLLTDACLASCWFDTEGKFEVKAILCESTYWFFKSEDGVVRFNFEISGLSGPTRTLYVHTILREPGVTIRLEQNHPGRRAGIYRQEQYPETQIKAANHYMFAMAEILKQMGIPEYLNSNGLGYMLLLGFETNNEVHGDYPPHWHLIYRWPKHCGSQAPHLYLDENGAITHNVCSIDKIAGAKRNHQTNEWCKFVDCYGRDVCAITATEDGGMLVTKPNSDIYRMSHYSDNGVSIWRGEKQIGNVKIDNDADSGRYTVTWTFDHSDGLCSDYTRIIDYDPLTGQLRNDALNITG